MATRQTNNNRLVSPKVLTDRAKSLVEDNKALARENSHQARCLVSLPGYQYLKSIGAQILSEYECQPGKTSEEKLKWETYTQMKWALDKTFSRIESIARANNN